MQRDFPHGLLVTIVLAATFAACGQPPAPEPAPPPEPLVGLVEGLASGAVEVVDLTQPLNAETPIIQLPPPLANTPGFTPHPISEFDDDGPAWYWN